jgi:hypothetical protein
MEKVQEPSNSECYTSSSGPFRIYLIQFILTAKYWKEVHPFYLTPCYATFNDNWKGFLTGESRRSNYTEESGYISFLK